MWLTVKQATPFGRENDPGAISHATDNLDKITLAVNFLPKN